MGVYYFARANQMEGHKFTDDVAIVWAMSKKSAIRKFSVLYANVQENEVDKICSLTSVRILTDY